MLFGSSIHEEELDERASSSADFFDEDSNLMPSGIDRNIPNPIGDQKEVEFIGDKEAQNNPPAVWRHQ
jgi:hypothetical protein